MASTDAEDARSEMGVSGLLGLSRDVSKEKASNDLLIFKRASQGTEIADAITATDLEERTAETGPGKKEKTLISLSQSEENMMEALEAMADDGKGTARALSSTEGVEHLWNQASATSNGLFDTMDKASRALCVTIAGVRSSSKS